MHIIMLKSNQETCFKYIRVSMERPFVFQNYLEYKYSSVYSVYTVPSNNDMYESGASVCATLQNFINL